MKELQAADSTANDQLDNIEGASASFLPGSSTELIISRPTTNHSNEDSYRHLGKSTFGPLKHNTLGVSRHSSNLISRQMPPSALLRKHPSMSLGSLTHEHTTEMNTPRERSADRASSNNAQECCSNSLSV